MCDCYKIGGPFIAEDPDCPEHGVQAMKDREEKEAEIDTLKAQRDELLAALNRLVTERHAGLASKEAWDVARAAIAKAEGRTE